MRSVGGQPVSAEAGDDPGMILYLSLLGHAFGTSDPLQLLKWFFVTAFALLLAIYPILWFEILSSLTAAVISPILLLFQFRFLAIHDIYWIAAWCILLCVPLITFVYQRWGRRSLVLLSGAMLVASGVSSIRAQAGLPIFLAGSIVVLLRERLWTRRLMFIAVLGAVYISISGFSMSAVRHYRNESVGVDLSKQYTSSHTLWHPAYLGFGALPNSYGIKWLDSIGIEAARKEKPNVVYLSPEYEQTIRHVYFSFVRKHPAFVVHSYLTKATVVLSDAFRRFWFGLLILPAVLLVRSRIREEMRLFALLLLPGAALGIIPPILGVPGLSYEFGWLGVWGAAWLLSTLWLAAVVPWPRLAAATRSWGSASLASGRFQFRFALAEARSALSDGLLRPGITFGRTERAGRWCIGITVGLCAFALWLNHVADPVRAESFYQLTQADLSPLPVRHGATQERWSFGEEPMRWSLSEGTRTLRHANHIDVMTSDQRFGYQLVSPLFRLRPGAYGVLVDGDVRAGALALEVLDVAKRRFVVENRYSAQERHSQTNFKNGRMFARFSLASDAQVQVVLSNWAPTVGPPFFPRISTAKSSHWRIESVSLVRQERLCGCSPPDSDAWISK